jgi:hypothetical protein
MLESGEYATIAELAEREGIATSYMTRVLRLTLLAPDIVTAVVDGRQGQEVTLARVLEPFPVDWGSQHAFLELPLWPGCRSNARIVLSVWSATGGGWLGARRRGQ